MVINQELKKNHSGTHPVQEYEDIHMPKNTPLGLYISGFAFLFSFGIIWHIYWLVPVALLGVILCVAYRSFDYDIDYYVPAAEVKRIEERNARHASHN